jgi:pimeloyl-ACP methyl ester carboxylesterase
VVVQTLVRRFSVAVASLLVAAACGTGGEDVDSLPPLVTIAEPSAQTSAPEPDPDGDLEAASPDGPEEPDEPLPSSTSTVPIPPTEIDQIDCPAQIRSDDLACGLATVPVDRGDPAAGTTTVSLAVLAGADSAAATPLAVLQGGPGGSSTDLARYFPQRDFPQVFVDQRGTGFGGSDFDCPEVDAALAAILTAASEAGEQIELAAYESCAARLRDDPVLAATDTSSQAADVVDVMTALGYERWIVYGVSYGTTIGLEIMRTAPAGLVGAVLDSVYPGDIDVDRALAESATTSLAELDRSCEADPDCDAILGDVTGTLDALMDRLELEPLHVAVEPDETSLGVALDVVIDGDVLAGMVFRLLYSESRLRFIPGLLEGLDRSDPDTQRWLARAVVDLSVSSLESNDDGTWFAVQCADRLPFTEGLPAGLDDFAASIAGPVLAELCEPWHRQPSPTSAGEPVSSDIPALVLGGQFDPITPPEFSRRVGRELSAATTVIRAGLAHGVWQGDDCVAGLVDAFVADPGAVLDTTCAAEPVPVSWRRPTQ